MRAGIITKPPPAPSNPEIIPTNIPSKISPCVLGNTGRFISWGFKIPIEAMSIKMANKTRVSGPF